MFIDPIYLVVAIPGMLFAMWASWRVNANFTKYSQVPASSGLTGAQAAAEVMRHGGVTDVEIVNVPGVLTDHYDPQHKRLALSDATYSQRSVAAVGVAAHEAGHALQHAQGYAPMNVRQVLVGPASFGSNAGIWIVVIGALMHSALLVKVGILLFGAVVLFQLVTLPVEFDASFRAKRILVEAGIVSREEREGVDKVLNAAGWTYVAAAASSVMTLLYYAWRYLGLGSSDD